MVPQQSVAGTHDGNIYKYLFLQTTSLFLVHEKRDKNHIFETTNIFAQNSIFGAKARVFDGKPTIFRNVT